MARLILFGGGDAGGIYIGPNGVTRIPPWDPPVLQLRGLAAMLNGSAALTGNARAEMDALTAKAAHAIVAQLQGSIGNLEGENTVLFADGDDVVVCGSTGKPTYHGPRPHGPGPVVLAGAARMQERELAAERVKMA